MLEAAGTYKARGDGRTQYHPDDFGASMLKVVLVENLLPPRLLGVLRAWVIFVTDGQSTSAA
jgi:hypothetical protein